MILPGLWQKKSQIVRFLISMGVGWARWDWHHHKAAAEHPCHLRGHRYLFPQPNTTPCPAEGSPDSESMAFQSSELWAQVKSMAHLTQSPPQTPSPLRTHRRSGHRHRQSNLPCQSNQRMSHVRSCKGKRSVVPEPCFGYPPLGISWYRIRPNSAFPVFVGRGRSTPNKIVIPFRKCEPKAHPRKKSEEAPMASLGDYEATATTIRLP